MLQKLSSYFVLSIIVVGMAMPAQAINKDDDDYYNEEKGSIISYLVNRDMYKVNFFNAPHISESKFTIRFSFPSAISGCARTTANTVEIDRINDKIRLTIKDSELYLNNTAPRYSHTDCKISQNNVFFDVQLDRSELIKHKVKSIRVKSKKYGEFSVLDVKISKEKILYKTSSDGDTSTFWFFPKNTIMLHVSKGKSSDNFVELINALATSNGLIPLESKLTKYHTPHGASDYKLFIDPTGHISSQLKSFDDSVSIGIITPTKTMYNANGEYEQPYELNVNATLPRQNKVNKP